jgi:hypothetical protein
MRGYALRSSVGFEEENSRSGVRHSICADVSKSERQ